MKLMVMSDSMCDSIHVMTYTIRNRKFFYKCICFGTDMVY